MGDKQKADGQVSQAIRQMEVAANNVAIRLARSAQVRQRYVAEIKEMSDALWAAYKSGEISAQKGAEVANQMRNQILGMSRANDMDFGRAYAKSLKKTGLELDKVINYIMNNKRGFKERFAGRLFTELTPAQQAEIYEEVIKSAGRDRGAVTKGIPRMRWAARGLWIATAAIAIYNVGTSQTPWWQAGREGANIGGGVLGSIAGGAAMGAAGGVWAGPIGVGVGVIVGGILGALLADHAYVEVIGTADAGTRTFIDPFTSFWTGVDEEGMAKALADQYSNRLDFVLRVMQALDNDYSSDSDDVALAYVQIAMKRPALAQAVKGNRQLRDFLISLLDSGVTFADERRAISWLRQ